MARVILLNPPLPEQNGMPLLSQLYIASSLLKFGNEVKIIDLNAKYFKYDLDAIISEINSYQPDAICMGLYTPTARFVYAFVSKLRASKGIVDCIYVAGGPHATAVPEEPLNSGFDVVVRGEGEFTINALMDNLEGKIELSKINGISYKTESGAIPHGKNRPLIEDLDALPLPVDSIGLLNPGWYFKTGTMKNAPASLITSRGCPSRCTYCANIVTGRKFRYRSAVNIINEMNYYHTNYDTSYFSFWDDAFTSNTQRVLELCDEFIRVRKTEGFEFLWSCNTRADKLSNRLVSAMARAGCISINFGVESGSPETLKRIRKGIDLNQVVKSLKWCKSEGLRAQVNFMLGFPWEGVSHLQKTLDFMKKIDKLVDAFSTRGVVIPFPGTELYETYKDKFGLDSWWLRSFADDNDESNKIENIDDQQWSEDHIKKVYLEDPVLDMDFFKYSPSVKNMIEKCLEYKGLNTMKKLGITY